MKYLILIASILFTQCLFASKKYKVIAIDSIPALKEYIVVLKRGTKEFKIISAYDSNKVKFNNCKRINIGNAVTIKLELLDRIKTPYYKLFETSRNGSEPIYIDGKLFDPKTLYYYTSSINDLYFCQ